MSIQEEFELWCNKYLIVKGPGPGLYGTCKLAFEAGVARERERCYALAKSMHIEDKEHSTAHTIAEAIERGDTVVHQDGF